ncbi:DUF7064 domain-containing protein [Sphingomonas sp. ID0503]|uniref:DUF7064 domain-containing protein n=1 Tax=Sphingomonas sp. ID0503 TaxID=3399691 RepID=UPI003AFA055D
MNAATSLCRLARPGLAVDPIHDNRHSLPDLPTARESSPYLLHLPDEGIACFTYTWVNGNSEAGAALAIFGPGVGAPIEQKLADRPIPRDVDWRDWRIEGFEMRQDVQFGHADVRWESAEALVEFSFDAFHPPYAYGTNAEGCPSYAATDRIEQSGHVAGRFVLAGREIPFTTVGHRDHSWGTRDWGAFQHYNWFQGQSADGTSIHWWRFLVHGRMHLRGYVVKDGLMAEVTDVQSDVTFDEALWQQRLTATVTDEAGRRTEVTAEFYAHYTLRADAKLHLREGAARATFDGRPGNGWLEVAWPPAYLEHAAR